MYNLVVFASGNGSTLQSIIDNIDEGKLNDVLDEISDSINNRDLDEI